MIIRNKLGQFMKGNNKGKHPWNFKGGYLNKTRAGKYKRVYKPNHPLADKRGYVYEHKLVMEKHLGRFLTRKEIVHHIDQNTENNIISNLQLFPDVSAHTRYHILEFGAELVDIQR